LLFFIISWIPVVSDVFANLLNLITYFLNQTIHLLELLPHPLSHHISIDILETWLIYALMISGIVALIYRRAKAAFFHFALWIVIFGLQIFENHNHLQQRAIVIHDASGKTAISLVKGQECLFLYNENLASDAEAMLFHVQNFWDSRDVMDVHYQAVDSLLIHDQPLLDQHLFQWCDKRLVFLNQDLSRFKFPKRLKVDYAIVADYYLDDLSAFTEHFEFDTIVFTGYHSAPDKQTLIKQATELEIEIWDVREKGALVSYY
jgi:hypothetical protein